MASLQPRALPRTGKITRERESRMVVARAWGRETGSWSESRISALPVGKSSGDWSCDNVTTRNTAKTYTKKMVKMVNFTLHVFLL